MVHSSVDTVINENQNQRRAKVPSHKNPKPVEDISEYVLWKHTALYCSNKFIINREKCLVNHNSKFTKISKGLHQMMFTRSILYGTFFITQMMYQYNMMPWFWTCSYGNGIQNKLLSSAMQWIYISIVVLWVIFFFCIDIKFVHIFYRYFYWYPYFLDLKMICRCLYCWIAIQIK